MAAGEVLTVDPSADAPWWRAEGVRRLTVADSVDDEVDFAGGSSPVRLTRLDDPEFSADDVTTIRELSAAVVREFRGSGQLDRYTTDGSHSTRDDA